MSDDRGRPQARGLRGGERTDARREQGASPPVSEPLVSLVTPFYNTAAYLPQCIESVLNQSYRTFEYVLVNNCSTDDSLAIAERYARADPRIRVVSNTRFLGQLANYNGALRQIAPESCYCKIVQADDWIFPSCLREMVAVAEARPSIGLVGAYTLLQTVVYLDGLPYPSTFMPGREVCRRFLLDGLFVFGSPTATLLRADLVRARDPFYDVASPLADVDVCFELLQEADFGFVHQVLTFTRRENESIMSSIKTFNVLLLAEMMAIEKYGLKFLSPEEHKRRREEIGRRYHAALGEAALRLKPRAFWEFHRRGLRSAGRRLSLGRVGAHVVLEALKLGLNPLDTAMRAWARYRRVNK